MVSGEIDTVINSNSITDIYYFFKKYLGNEKAIEIIQSLDGNAKIVSVNRDDVMNAIALNWNDLEDALISCVASVS
ncbi:hypothetical protein FACS189465_3640 [Clostridia bacterium]|nr:hypothetical protein FACS189465_3640 [Clostridia bacterium]